ncbi:MAG TPA: glycosyltransferase [Acidimicrobiales bacterium]|nr:glycosyltransferase [Acidimicrobiales bacterium]
MTEIAAVVAAAISDLGYETVYPAAGLPEDGPNRVNLVVAPHEFFPLQLNHTKDELQRAAEASVVLGVEQPGTSWFELGYHFASVSRQIVDISPYAVAELQRRGYSATHLQFGYHRSWDCWHGVPGARPTDLLFLGASTARREEILSSVGTAVWEFDCDIRLFEHDRPMNVPRAHFVAGEDKWRLLSSARVLLNIHRSEVRYFEWIRVLEAVINGALVVTELSSDYGPLIPGEHFLTASKDFIAAQTASILMDEPLRAEIASSAYDFVRQNLTLETMLEPICDQLNDTTKTRSGTQRRAAPLTLQKTVPTSSDPVLEAALDVERRVRVRIKELLDSETDLVQSVEALQATLLYSDRNHVESFTTPSWSDFVPEVSVIITCYNYSGFVLDAIESVFASTGVRVELIVVDDHSQDDSVEVITSCMGRAPWFPMKLLARAANAGLGAARDLGIRHSRSDRVFMLDADNAIFPTALRKLAFTLDEEPDAAFAYGIIAKIGQPGLLSQFPWHVERLARANYIDAMAMLRKKVCEEVGGYDASLRGWEDYELWLRVADHGYRGAFLHDFIGTYRVHGESLLQTVNIDVSGLVDDFKERYRLFPWDQS